jgi:hypothetical protein
VLRSWVASQSSFPNCQLSVHSAQSLPLARLCTLSYIPAHRETYQPIFYSIPKAPKASYPAHRFYIEVSCDRCLFPDSIWFFRLVTIYEFFFKVSTMIFTSISKTKTCTLDISKIISFCDKRTLENFFDT